LPGDALQAVALLRAAAAGVVDQDLAHGTGGNPQEVLAVLHAQGSRRRKPQEGFVHQAGSLQRVGGPFVAEQGGGKAVQLIVDEVYERGRRSRRRGFV
jgi:hypothetical protein